MLRSRLDEQEHRDQMREHMRCYLPKNKRINPASVGAGASAKGQWLPSSSSFHFWNSWEWKFPLCGTPEPVGHLPTDWQGTTQLLHRQRQRQPESEGHEWGRGPTQKLYIQWHLLKGKVLQENQIVWGAERLLKINKSLVSWRFLQAIAKKTIIVQQYFTESSLMPIF